MKDSSQLSLLHLNIRSLPAHYDALYDLCTNLNHAFHFIALSETWLSQQSDGAYNLPGYQLEVSCRLRPQPNRLPTQPSHGGVALYINSSLPYAVRNDVTISTEWCESLFVEVPSDYTSRDIVPHKTKSILVGIIYRSPQNKKEHFLAELERVLCSYRDSKTQIIIMGDINIDVSQNDSSSFNYIDLLTSQGLEQLIKSPTRISSSKRSILDHIIIDYSSTTFKTGTILSDITDL